MTPRLARHVPTLALLWLGLVIGISFIATPVKFHAKALTFAAALDVGRHTFAASHVAQLVVAALLALGALAVTRRIQLVLLAAIAILIVQHVLLLPILEARAAAIIDGDTVPSTASHLVYVALELAKAVCLGIVGVAATPRRPSTLWRT